MLEGLWLLLLGVACLHPKARLQALLLLFSWLMSYGAVYISGKTVEGYQIGTLMETFALLVSIMIVKEYRLHRCWWALYVTAAYAVSVCAQVVYWRLWSLGIGSPVNMYLTLVLLYSSQVGALAWAGLRYRVRRWRPLENLKT